MTAIGILGSEGRMGRAIAAIAADFGATVAGGVDADGDPLALAKSADVLVDFTAPSALEANLAAACEAGTPIVVGTTGLGQAHHDLIDNAAARVAVLQTSTTSLGVTLLARIVADAAARLGPEWDIEIVEAHHRHKVDAPSGTALLLGDAAAEGRGAKLADLKVVDRAGLTGARSEGTIGFASIRGGSIAGDHQVIFAGPGERLELIHRAESREMFARGAVRAAMWLAGQPAGRYTMPEVLGL
ncbi:4-hydroxy-tetrahydrodipicolinate reductase [Sphingomonas pruni]|uniref:4-hydroxy-tetrahydrodipicolinate reductase n=1 Tax=Sphingomonas pruni TaxID=40683 RepID=UPI00082B16E1|nr:4-hydroxy-tetrahydrodipicolinate reductase [Sphingomonas pruni]